MVVEMTKCPECGYEGKKKNGYPYKSKANYSHNRKYYRYCCQQCGAVKTDRRLI